MLAKINIDTKEYQVDFSKPLDISIPLRSGKENVNAFYIPPVQMIPFSAGNFTGDVSQGGSCNVFSISFNPHGNGTHTETVGHISSEKYPISKFLNEYFFEARLISISPDKINGDSVITYDQLKNILKDKCPAALIIRTLPNDVSKMNHQYSGTNPAYLDPAAAEYIASLNIKHLILDLPSIDREDDGGKLSAHHAFWKYPQATRKDCTITELAFIDSDIKDGNYLLNLMVASFDNDASPSKPVLYALNA